MYLIKEHLAPLRNKQLGQVLQFLVLHYPINLQKKEKNNSYYQIGITDFLTYLSYIVVHIFHSLNH